MMPDLTKIFGSYQAIKFDEGTWFINFMEGSQNLYLLEGEEKALLVDAGYGTNTLAAFVKTLTNKPLLVANTHFHPDHAGGNGEFPSVMMHCNWAADANAVKPGPNLPFDISALPYPDYEKIPLCDGDIIELGNRSIEVLDICAHSNSSLAFLDRSHRLLLCGDELEAAQVLLYDLSASGGTYDLPARLRAHRNNMLRLKALQSQIDHLLPNHNGFPIDTTYIDDFIDLTDAIFAGKAEIEDKLNHPFIEVDPIAPRLCRVKHGRVSFFVEKEELMVHFYGMERPKVIPFTHEKVTDRITRIRDVSGVCMYLVEGSEKNALIDTGVGFGDLHSYVMGLTEKEPIVILTHGHVDHAMGTGKFQDVYLSFEDIPLYRAHSAVAVRQDYVQGSGISGGHPELIAKLSDCKWEEVKADSALKDLQPGQIFDLGGICLEICPGAGHTKGTVTILIPEERVLILGDAANDFTFLFDLAGVGGISLSQYQRNMKTLSQQVAGQYDRCLFFHGPGEGPTEMLAGIITLIDDILAGKDDALPFAAMGRNDLNLAKEINFEKMCRADGGIGNLVYDPALK